MAIHKLPANFVEVRKRGVHNDGGGLYAQVGKDGETGSWIFRYRYNGRQRYMGLGSFNTIGLAQARELARQCREQVKNGTDPINARDDAALAQRLAAAKRVSVAACFEQWAKIQNWVPSTLYSVRNRFNNHILPKLGNLPVGAITTDLLEQVFSPIWETIPVQTKHAIRDMSAMLDWAIDAKDYHPGPNPMRKLKLRLKPFDCVHTIQNYRALPWQQAGAFVAQLRAFTAGTRKPERPLSAYVLEFTILTGVRSHQARQMRWNDIDPDKREWQCEKHKTVKKTKAPHIIPLSDAAWAILEIMRDWQSRDEMRSDHVFVHCSEGNSYYQPKKQRWRGRIMSPTTASVFLHESLKRPDLTVHGFRTTFRSWAKEMGWPFEDAEMALGHAVGNQVQQIYLRQAMRLNERRKLMEAWAEHCNRTEPLDAKVIPMKRKA
jgi:integrase